MKAGLRISSVATGMGMFLLLWQVLAWVVARPILPPPTVVLPLFVRLMGADLGLHLAASAARVTVSVLLAILAAVPLGLGLGQMRAIDRVVAPLVAIVYPIPKIVVETYQVLRYPEMYAGILAMSLLGLGFYFLVSTLEQKVTRYLRP